MKRVLKLLLVCVLLSCSGCMTWRSPDEGYLSSPVREGYWSTPVGAWFPMDQYDGRKNDFKFPDSKWCPNVPTFGKH